MLHPPLLLAGFVDEGSLGPDQFGFERCALWRPFAPLAVAEPAPPAVDPAIAEKAPDALGDPEPARGGRPPILDGEVEGGADEDERDQEDVHDVEGLSDKGRAAE